VVLVLNRMFWKLASFLFLRGVLACGSHAAFEIDQSRNSVIVRFEIGFTPEHTVTRISLKNLPRKSHLSTVPNHVVVTLLCR
jgi:hypothetical protein